MNTRITDCLCHDADYIESKLVQYNLSKVAGTQDVALMNIHKKIVDENDNILAGCLAVIYCWKIMYVEILWVDEAYRKQGLGTTLLKEIERIATENSCSLIHLDTFDFQAKDFYLRHGYEIFGVLEDCPENHCRYYLKKKLNPTKKSS